MKNFLKSAAGVSGSEPLSDEALLPDSFGQTCDAPRMRIKEIIEGAGGETTQPEAPDTGALEHLIDNVNAAVAALQECAGLLIEKSGQLANHEHVLADKKRHGHFKAGAGFVYNSASKAHDVDFPEAVQALVAPAVNEAVENAVEIMGADAAATLAAAGGKVADAAGYAAAAAASATASASGATSAKTAQTAAESAKSAADTSKTAAATSAANAANSAGAASTSAGNAASSATTASTKATEAANSATAANTAKTGAETAKSGAESALSAARAVISSPVAADANKKLLAAGAGAGKWAANASLISKAGARSAAIDVNGTFTVPSYVAGAKQIAVYLEGCRCNEGEHYSEAGTAGAASTSIKWLIAVPVDYAISVFVTP